MGKIKVGDVFDKIPKATTAKMDKPGYRKMMEDAKGKWIVLVANDKVTNYQLASSWANSHWGKGFRFKCRKIDGLYVIFGSNKPRKTEEFCYNHPLEAEDGFPMIDGECILPECLEKIEGPLTIDQLIGSVAVTEGEKKWTEFYENYLDRGDED